MLEDLPAARWRPTNTDWEPHGGAFETGPAITTWNGANSLAIFGSQINGTHYLQDWNGPQWLPDSTSYTSILNLSSL